MASPPKPEELDATMATFNTDHTSGMVQNVNGDFIVHGSLNYTINCIVEGPAPDMRQLLKVLPKIYTTPTIAPSLGTEGHPTVCGPMAAQAAATHVTINNFEATSAKDSSIAIEIRVIAEMMDILLENPSLHHSDTLPETLASLQRMLTLTKLALRAYQQTPLAHTLNRAIAAEAERCHQLLKDLFKRLADYRHTLPAVFFQFIRQYIWSTVGEGSEFRALNTKLGQCHSSLAACVLALGSAAWPELERGKAGKTALAEFYSLFAQESASLRHIQIDAVIVIDHLGRNLPVPTIFCNSWQDFHAVIVGHCESFAGDSLVQRGDYRILKQDDDQFIAPAELSATVRPGMTVEMSIVMRGQAPEEYGGAEHKCPRCSHVNSKVVTASGWVSCQRCWGNFRVLSYTEGGDGEKEELVSPEVQQPEADTKCFFRRICILLTDNRTLVTPPGYVQPPLFPTADLAELKPEYRRSRSSSVDSDVETGIIPPPPTQSETVPLPGESSHHGRPSNADALGSGSSSSVDTVDTPPARRVRFENIPRADALRKGLFSRVDVDADGSTPPPPRPILKHGAAAPVNRRAGPAELRPPSQQSAWYRRGHSGTPPPPRLKSVPLPGAARF